MPSATDLGKINLSCLDMVNGFSMKLVSGVFSFSKRQVVLQTLREWISDRVWICLFRGFGDLVVKYSIGSPFHEQIVLQTQILLICF